MGKLSIDIGQSIIAFIIMDSLADLEENEIQLEEERDCSDDSLRKFSLIAVHGRLFSK